MVPRRKQIVRVGEFKATRLPDYFGRRADENEGAYADPRRTCPAFLSGSASQVRPPLPQYDAIPTALERKLTSSGTALRRMIFTPVEQYQCTRHITLIKMRRFARNGLLMVLCPMPHTLSGVSAMKLAIAAAILAILTTAVQAETYLYMCRVGHKSYPVVLATPPESEADEHSSSGGMIIWHDTVFENVKEVGGCRAEFMATRDGVSSFIV